jgi:hypothetical protein
MSKINSASWLTVTPAGGGRPCTIPIVDFQIRCEPGPPCREGRYGAFSVDFTMKFSWAPTLDREVALMQDAYTFRPRRLVGWLFPDLN